MAKPKAKRSKATKAKQPKAKPKVKAKASKPKAKAKPKPKASAKPKPKASPKPKPKASPKSTSAAEASATPATPEPHTLTMDTGNLYSLSTDEQRLGEAGISLQGSGEPVRLVFGARFAGRQTTPALFVERKTGTQWLACSDEITGDAVAPLLVALGLPHAADLVAEILDGREGFFLDGD